jgi:hypothetical protein
MNTTSPSAIDGKTFAIGILSVTACILFVGLLFVSQPPALGFGMSDRGGDYIMVTQIISNSDETVDIIDAAAKQMVVYRFDYNNKTLNILRNVALDQLPKPGRDREAPARPQGGGRRQ